MGANYAGVIASRLSAYGFSKFAIAGILGNLQAESGLNPSSGGMDSNGLWSGGLAQWNGSRYKSMQAFARARGKPWTDVVTQIDFLVSEVSPQLKADLNSAQSAGYAALVFVNRFEISSALIPQRIAYANAWYHSGTIGSGSAALGSMATGGSRSGGGSAIPAASRLGDPNPSASDYRSALGSLAGLLTAIPELHSILQQAVQGGWAVTKFQQAITQSHWYRSNNAATRALIALAYSDPAEYRTQLAQASAQVSQLAQQMGVPLNAGQLSVISHEFLTNGWTQATLQADIARQYNLRTQPQGKAAGIYQGLNQIYGDYGLPNNFASSQFRTREILSGRQTLDTYKQAAIKSAKSLYPGIAPEIDQGMSVRDIASPYIQTQANLLEIDPASINFGNDAGIKKALQGVPNAVGARVAVPLWQYEQQVRSDPRWQFTNNSRDTVSSALVRLGADFGFGPSG